MHTHPPCPELYFKAFCLNWQWGHHASKHFSLSLFPRFFKWSSQSCIWLILGTTSVILDNSEWWETVEWTMRKWLGGNTLLCHVHNWNQTWGGKERWEVSIKSLFNGYFFQPWYLGLLSIPTPQESPFVMSELPIATIGCGEWPDDQTKLKGCDSSLSWGGEYIQRTGLLG